MRVNESGPLKTVFISYRYKDRPRFDLVREITSRLRLFSIRVILDQRSLLYGEDIKAFMTETIRSADAVIVLLSQDYNQALLQDGGPGEGVRFEVKLALEERDRRSDFRIIPVLLDSSRPVAPFDKLKCARPSEIDEITTQLGLVESLAKSRMLADRYRIDHLIETRGFARLFEGRDLVLDVPIEVYMVPPTVPELQGERFRTFERVLKGRSVAFSPFLLNLRDSYVSADGAYYLVTERFAGTDLSVPLSQGVTTHPLGALCIAYQVILGLYELHNAGVLHCGLAPRAIRHNRQRTLCKIVDFEFARPIGLNGGPQMDGYPLISPPERFAGSPPSVQQDIYQIGNLVFWLICGYPVVSRSFRGATGMVLPFSSITTEDPQLQSQLRNALSDAVSRCKTPPLDDSDWAQAFIQSKSVDFIRGDLTSFVAWCLHPDPKARPKSAGEILRFFARLAIPPAGRFVGQTGREKPDALFPIYDLDTPR